MALFFPGMKCPLCDQAIIRDQPRRLFPPFVKSSDDPLFILNDARCTRTAFCVTPVHEPSMQRCRRERCPPPKEPIPSGPGGCAPFLQELGDVMEGRYLSFR
jgi:hypothetical protein